MSWDCWVWISPEVGNCFGVGNCEFYQFWAGGNDYNNLFALQARFADRRRETDGKFVPCASSCIIKIWNNSTLETYHVRWKDSTRKKCVLSVLQTAHFHASDECKCEHIQGTLGLTRWPGCWIWSNLGKIVRLSHYAEPTGVVGVETVSVEQKTQKHWTCRLGGKPSPAQSLEGEIECSAQRVTKCFSYTSELIVKELDRSDLPTQTSFVFPSRRTSVETAELLLLLLLGSAAVGDGYLLQFVSATRVICRSVTISKIEEQFWPRHAACRSRMWTHEFLFLEGGQINQLQGSVVYQMSNSAA